MGKSIWLGCNVSCQQSQSVLNDIRLKWHHRCSYSTAWEIVCNIEVVNTTKIRIVSEQCQLYKDANNIGIIIVEKITS